MYSITFVEMSPAKKTVAIMSEVSFVLLMGLKCWEFIDIFLS